MFPSHDLDGEFPDDVILEIGSDRYERSSYYFADLADQHDMRFITVDLDQRAVARALRGTPKHWLPRCEFIHAEATEWTSKFGQRDDKIRVLYLDNFDWDWSTERYSDMIAEQKIWYSKNGMTMNNLNCQVSHVGQMVNLLPYMTDRCVVCVDDTYEYNGVYIGKGGAIVPYLMSQGFGLLRS